MFSTNLSAGHRRKQSVARKGVQKVLLLIVALQDCLSGRACRKGHKQQVGGQAKRGTLSKLGSTFELKIEIIEGFVLENFSNCLCAEEKG